MTTTPIRAKRGDTFTLTITRRNSAGAVVNLTGFQVRAQMRRAPRVITLTAQVTVPAGGICVLSAAPSATALWTPGVYACDVEYTSAGGEVESSETFYVEVLEDVTL